MDKYVYCPVFLIASCLLVSCSFSSKKLGYELEDRDCEYQVNDTEKYDTTVAVEEFDKYEIEPVFTEDNVVANRQSNANDKLLPMVYSDSKFSIRYPSTWEIAMQNERVFGSTLAVLIIQIAENNYAFRPNISIFVEKNKYAESTDSLARFGYNQQKDFGVATSLIGIRECSINGHHGSVAEYIGSEGGYELHYFQYTVKKKDNTTFIITVTLDHDNIASQKTLALQIIDSIKIF